MIVLGIETSCDETSAAVLIDGEVKSNVISSQLVHSKYGGVVPELASRAHQRLIIEVVEEALGKASVTRKQVDGIAATYGPGLAGSLLVGLSFGKALAYGLKVPFVGVNHMEGHLYSNFLSQKKPEFPFIALIVSGGHTMLVHVEKHFTHTLLGQTRDDAAGEAFDKVAKMLGLGYPGGPIVDELAEKGNPFAVNFPRTYLDRGSYDFSFSGVKTAVLYHLRHAGLLDADLRRNRTSMDAAQLADTCASFQEAVVEVLVDKTMMAAERLDVRDVTIAGGVSANSHLRSMMKESVEKSGRRLFHPRAEYCMDNGAMIAYVGWLKLQQGLASPFELPAVANLELV